MSKWCCRKLLVSAEVQNRQGICIVGVRALAGLGAHGRKTRRVDHPHHQFDVCALGIFTTRCLGNVRVLEMQRRIGGNQLLVDLCENAVLLQPHSSKFRQPHDNTRTDRCVSMLLPTHYHYVARVCTHQLAQAGAARSIYATTCIFIFLSFLPDMQSNESTRTPSQQTCGNIGPNRVERPACLCCKKHQHPVPPQ